MSTIKLKFPDGKVQEFPKGITPREIAEKVSPRLFREALGAVYNGQIWDLHRPIPEDGEIRLVTFDDPEGRHVFWHSSAHLMAQAIKRLWPQAKLGIGPAIEDGFYYDIDLDHPISPDEFELVEKEMARIVDEGHEIRRRELSREEALELFKKRNEDLKLELIQELEGDISAYEQAEFVDLCKGPHLPNTKLIGKNFKILSVAGAYWRGNEKNKMLQRLYATAYPKKSLLEEHLKRLEEAKKRDHRKLGKELDLFSIQESIGNGLILWHPKGARIRRIIEDFWVQEHYKNGYELINTPHIARFDLWETSGHAGFYSENMFSPIEVEEVRYQLKPMNCPFHITVYKSHLRSYRDLPIRYAELGTVYRYERSGVLHGLMRVRGFTQDDAHIFCRADQVKEEFVKVIDLVLYVFKSLDFHDFTAQVSLRDKENKAKYIGSEENWERAEREIQEAAQERGLKTVVEYGEAAFYGPKLDFMVKDALGRSWQLGTIQVDYNLPERFELEYTGADNQKHRPVMIHRAPFGSLERFIAVLTEHCAGNFPLWLAPIQVAVLPISDKFNDYAKKVVDLLKNNEIRTLFDDRPEKIGKKIRDSEVMKIPFMLVVGEKEEAQDVVAVREHGKGDLGTMSREEFVNLLKQRIADKLN